MRLMAPRLTGRGVDAREAQRGSDIGGHSADSSRFLAAADDRRRPRPCRSGGVISAAASGSQPVKT